MEQWFVYVMASEWRTLYVGMTSALELRVRQHRAGVGCAFTKRYKCNRLVYVEQQMDRRAAEARERQLKSWKRYKKIALIDAFNPEWRDLFVSWRRALR